MSKINILIIPDGNESQPRFEVWDANPDCHDEEEPTIEDVERILGNFEVLTATGAFCIYCVEYPEEDCPENTRLDELALLLGYNQFRIKGAVVVHFFTGVPHLKAAKDWVDSIEI